MNPLAHQCMNLENIGLGYPILHQLWEFWILIACS